jgi:hypothetical protein
MTMRHALHPAREFFSDTVPRIFYKFIYKHSHPRAYRHNRLYWPHYRVERSSLGQLERIHFKKHLVVDNTHLERSHNKACMLIATGPSIKRLDKTLFQRSDIDYIGVNGAISLNDVKFRYYVIIDLNFTKNRFDLVERVLDSRCTLFTVPRCLDLILRRTRASKIHCDIKVVELISQGEIERFFGPKVRVDTSKGHFFEYCSFGFSGHIFDAVYDYFTVTYVALQIIGAMQYRKVYIAGLDMNQFTQPRFYEDAANKQSTMLNQYSNLIFPAFDAAAKYFSERNVRVYNLSTESAVDSFEKIPPYQDSFLATLA